MRVERYPGGIYADCLPSGEYVYGIGRTLHTHFGAIALPPGETQSLFNRITNAGGVKIATKSHAGFDTHVWDGAWTVDGRTSHGVQGHIWSPDGVLHVIEPGAHQVTTGYVSWEASGPVLAWTREWSGRIYRWTEHGDVRVGLGDLGGIAVRYQGELYMLEPGDTQFYEFHRSGDSLAIAVTKLAENEAVLFWLGVSEIASLPRYGTQPVPVPVPIPQPAPQPQEPPVSTPDRSAIVQQVAASFPHLLQINTFASCGEFVQRVLAAMPAEGWGHVGKSAGEAGHTAPNGVRFSHDVIWHQPTNQQIDILGYAAANSHPDPVEVEPGPATVSWQVIPPEHYRASNPWLAPVPVQHASPVPVPMPTPDTPCAECAGLKERITNLDGIVEALVERLKVVEDRPAPTPAPLPKRLRLKGSTGGTWRHAHGIDAVFDVEPEG